MRNEDFNMKEHGFVGHIAEPEGGSDKAVFVPIYRLLKKIPLVANISNKIIVLRK